MREVTIHTKRGNYWGVSALSHLSKRKLGRVALPKLLWTNIVTNEEVGDRNIFRIDDCLYQVHRSEDGYDIIKLN